MKQTSDMQWMPHAACQSELKRPFGVKDLVFLAGLLVLGLVLTFAVYRANGRGRQIRITVDGALYGTYDLDTDQRIPIEWQGQTGNVVVIADGAAHMEQASCPDGLCKRQGAISRERQTIVCLPHRLVVEVYGTDENETEYDTISQ